MKKSLKKIIKKQWILLWVVAVSSALIFLGAYAAYTNINKVKRVVSTQGGAGTAFSSNYLSIIPKDTSNYDMKLITIPGNSDKKEFEINVCNYVQNNPSMINENTINYNMKFTLVNAASNDVITDEYNTVSVKIGDVIQSFSKGVCEIASQSLAGKSRNSNTYTVTVPRDFIESVNIKVEAIPDETSYNYTGSNKLARIFTFAEYTETTTAWSGAFSETDINYDAFNYVVKGQGKGDFTLTWDPSQLEISQVFLNNSALTVQTTSDGKSFVVIEVDSDIISRYDIQFYKTASGDYTSIDKLKSYVSYTFVPQDTATVAEP